MLQALNADMLRGNRCYFGGGTAIVLRYGEFRESADIDFLVSDIDGYRELRQLLTGDAGINAITHQPLTTVRDVRADQYGIRTFIDANGSPLKFEIIHEGRIQLDTPNPEDQACGITTLIPMDLAASKLLANADRWADRSTFSRDVIDLAMMIPSPDTFTDAITKTTHAYGSSIERSLAAAIDYLRENPPRLDECIRALHMNDTPKAVLWQRIKALYPD